MATVTLIRSPSVVGRYALTLNKTPPLTLAYLAGSTAAAGHTTRVIDAVGEGMQEVRPGYRPDVLVNGLAIADIVERVDPRSDLIGVSCLFSTEWPVVRELVAALAQHFPGVPIVCGGEHPTAAPEHALRTAPELAACVLGEGEETLVDLLDAVASGRSLATVAGLAYLDQGRVVRTVPRARIREVDAIPLPRWDLVPIERYLDGGHSFGVDRGRTMPILATRGCPYRCTFCSSPSMWTTRYVMREPHRVVDEIALYVERYGAQNIDFYDLTAIVQKRWIVAFCEEMIARRVPVSWQLPSGTRSEAIDREVSRLLYAAGCRNVSYAPESGSRRTLERILKKVDPEQILDSMRGAAESGLNIKANILIGFPGERRADILETLVFIGRMATAGVHDVSVWTFSPYPGSVLFDELRAAGRIGELDDDYFAALLSYSDLAGAVSFDEFVSSRELRAFRLLGMGLFYAMSWARRPWRVVRAARNIVHGRYESRMEMSLANLVERLRVETRMPGASA